MLTGPPKTYYKFKKSQLEKRAQSEDSKHVLKPTQCRKQERCREASAIKGCCYVGPRRYFLQRFLHGGAATLPQPSSCKAKQPHAPLLAILPRVKLPLKTGCGCPGPFWFFWGEEKWGKMRKDEENGKRLCFELLSFLGDTCFLKLYLPAFSPFLLLSAPKVEWDQAKKVSHSERGAAGETGLGITQQQPLERLHTPRYVLNTIKIVKSQLKLFLTWSVSPHFISQIISYQSHLFLYRAFSNIVIGFISPNALLINRCHLSKPTRGLALIRCAQGGWRGSDLQGALSHSKKHPQIPTLRDEALPSSPTWSQPRKIPLDQGMEQQIEETHSI